MKMPNYGRNNVLVYFLLFLMIASGIAVPVLLNNDTSNRLKYYSSLFKEGELAEDDVFADNSFIFTDEKMTETLKMEASAAIPPVFYYHRSETLSNVQRRRNFTDALLAGNIDEAFTYLNPGTKISEPIRRALSGMNYRSVSRLLSVLEEIHTNLLNRGLYDYSELVDQATSKGYSTITLKSYMNSDGSFTYNVVNVTDCLTYFSMISHGMDIINTYSIELDPTDIMILAELIPALLVPNVRFNAIETVERKIEAENSIKPVSIPINKGDMLILKDSVISEKDVAIIKAMAKNSVRNSYLEVIGVLIFLIIISLACFIYISDCLSDEKFRRTEFCVLVMISIIVSIIGAYFLFPNVLGFETYAPQCYLPFFFAPMFILFTTGRRDLAFTTALLIAVYSSFFPFVAFKVLPFVLIVNVACILITKFVTGRLDMMLQWLSMAGIGVVAVFLSIIIGAQDLQNFVKTSVALIANISLCYVLVLLILPILEKLLNLPTYFRLKELAFTESPTLSRLSATCPGTYSHSKSVAELAGRAAAAIGAKELLTRVGGLYHDIGKIDHPEYFTENQTEGNKHDEIKPSLSVAIIKSHVKLGVEKAREIGLPPEVIDLISEHHGNDVIRFFYNEAVQSGADVSKSDYSYSGAEIPSSKEAGILMLADSVEAASRSMKGASPAAIDKLIHKIFMQKMENHQLDNCPLSMRDLDEIFHSFAGTIIGQTHSRVEYPDEEKK